jgi:23S rRNA (guanosine2251-2'-O)-methyltransferase
MPGNSANPSRRVTAKKGATFGSGGKNRAGLKGRGRTLPADERPWHKGYSGTEKLPEKTARKQDKERRAAAAEGRAPKVGDSRHRRTPRGVAAAAAAVPQRGGRVQPQRGRGSRPAAGPTHQGRPGAAARAQPGGRGAARGRAGDRALRGAGHRRRRRITEIVRTAGDRGIPILEISRNELDRMTGGVLHQGIGLQVPPFAYENFDDLWPRRWSRPRRCWSRWTA